MPRRLRYLSSALVAAVLAACGGDITPPPPPPPPPGPLPTPTVACASVSPVQVAVGSHVSVDPATTTGCVRFPAAGSAGAQYLMVLASTSGLRTTNGVEGPYLFRASSLGTSLLGAPEADQAAASGPPSPGRPPAGAQFDATLRQRERELLADPSNRPVLSTVPVPPTQLQIGDTKSFKVCSDLQCGAFGTVDATVQYVGQHVAIYVDNTVPQNDPLQPADFAELGMAFDNRHYPIDTTAFGRESDIDGNGVVDILMTDAVNALTPDCTNGRVIGFFFGGDLLNSANSNRAEVFYTLVPAPATTKCNAISRRSAIDNLKPTLIHEFQHMISFNQHGLVRGGTSEEAWLNEALSHFAEELGGRLVPNSECPNPPFVSCRSQYSSGNIGNAYDYLRDPEAHFMVFGSMSTGGLEERGAVWLFLRWTLDHFATDTILGTDMTRALVATTRTGATNLVFETGESFATMVPEWLMATYLDDGLDLPFESTGRLRYFSWGLRSIWTNPLNAQFFPAGFPVVPDAVAAGYSRTGTLRGGSGRHFLITQQANGAAIDTQVLKSTTGAQLDALLEARFGIVRVR
jgi:hypothetical protein